MKKYCLIFCLLFLYSCTEKGNINDSKHRNSSYAFYKEKGKEGYWQEISKNSNFKYKKGLLEYFYDDGNKFGEVEILENIDNRIERVYNRETKELALTVWYKNNSEYKRVYENGNHKFYYSNKGKIITEEGLVQNNLEQGLWKRYWGENGKIKEIINLKDGKPNGERKNYWKNGNLKSFANWESGIQSGKGLFYYENGTLEESNYRFNEKLNGKYKAYYPDKTLKTDCNYWNDKSIDTCRNYYSNGNLKKIEINKLDTISLISYGKAFFYYENGTLKLETEAKDYKPNGITKYYNQEGKLIEIMTFKNGIKIDSKFK